MALAALLTLADSRLPAGGHTHSGGVEQAIAAGIVHDPGSLTTFLRRRLHTSGAVAAGLAAAACSGGDLRRLDAEADARTPSPALRAASRQQGRGLVRVGRRAWPSPLWDALPAAPHHPVALGVAAAAGGLTARDAAAAAAYLSVRGPATSISIRWARVRPSGPVEYRPTANRWLRSTGCSGTAVCTMANSR